MSEPIQHTCPVCEREYPASYGWHDCPCGNHWIDYTPYLLRSGYTENYMPEVDGSYIPGDSVTSFKAVVNRLEVIDHTGDGRAYVKWVPSDFDVHLQLQDDDRTLKIFVKQKEQR